MALYCGTTTTADRQSSSTSSGNNSVSVKSLVDAFEANVESSVTPFPSFVSFSSVSFSSALHDSQRPPKSNQDHKLSIVTIGSESDAAHGVQRQCWEESPVDDVPPCRPALPPPSLLPDVVVCSTAVDKRQYAAKIENATTESSPFERNSPKSSLSNSMLKRPTSGPCPPIVNRPSHLDIRCQFTDNDSLTALAVDDRYGVPVDDPPTPILFAAVKSIFERQARFSHQHQHHGHSYQHRPHQHQLQSSSPPSCSVSASSTVDDRQRRIRVRKPVTSSGKDVGSIRRRESSVGEQLESPRSHHQHQQQQQQENPETEKMFETNCVLADENIDSPASGAVCRLKALFNHRTSSPASTERRLHYSENGLHRHVTVNKSTKAPIVPTISSVSVSACRSQAPKSNCSGSVIALGKGCNAGNSFEKRSKVACALNIPEKKSHLTVKFKESASNLQSSSDTLNTRQEPTDASHDDRSMAIIPRHRSKPQPDRIEAKIDGNETISRSKDTNTEQPLDIDLLSACRETSSEMAMYDSHTLNLSAHKQRVHLRQRGSLANRRKPSRASLRAASMASEASADNDVETGDDVIDSPAIESEEIHTSTKLMTKPKAAQQTTSTAPALPWMDELKQRWERRTTAAGAASLPTPATAAIVALHGQL